MQKRLHTVPWLDGINCLGALAIVGYLDYATGYRTSFLLFYLIPIGFTFWRLGFTAAIGMCVLSSLVWRGTNWLAGETYHDWLTPTWNTVLRLSIFVLVTVLWAVRQKLKTQVHLHVNALNAEVTKRAQLEKEVLETSEREQRRIGHDLHDSLCQHLTATALACKVLAKKLASQSQSEAEAANQVIKMIEQGIEQTRLLARNLHPIALEADGLVNGLRELAAAISQAFSVACKVECSQTISLATAEANMHLYRIAQEAISNAIRHGRATNVTLLLETRGNEIVLSIADDGIGVPSKIWKTRGMGLHIMNYRAGMIGAKLQVQKLAKRGTCVSCILPAQ